jgi:hypothetical protein
VKPHKLAHRNMLVRQGQANPNHLHGGEVPHYAPTQPITAKGQVKLIVDNTPKADPNLLAGLDPEVVRAIAVLKQTGLLDSILAAVTDQETKKA